MTVRQVFYRAVVKNYVEKTEKGYGFIQRNLSDMRWSGMMDFDWIIDTSRQVRGGQGSNWGLQEYVCKYFMLLQISACNHPVAWS
jgi:hypothetical protein